MRVIAFQGSPRIKGNTEVLLDAAVKGVMESGYEVKVFNLNLMSIRPCQDCCGCDETGMCVLEDEMTVIYDAIREADRIILASPVFFFGLSAQAKGMIDRCQAFWCEKYLLKRPLQGGAYGRKGLLLLVGGMKKEIGIQCCEASATAFFRTISVPEHETVSVVGVDLRGAIFDHPTALGDAHDAGKKLVS